MPPQAPPGARAVVLGLQLLQKVFASHEEARGEVLKVVQVREHAVGMRVFGLWDMWVCICLHTPSVSLPQCPV